MVANSKYRNQIQTYNQSNSRPTTVSSNGHQNKKSMTSFYVPASSIQRPRCTPIGFTICQIVDNYPRWVIYDCSNLKIEIFINSVKEFMVW